MSVGLGCSLTLVCAPFNNEVVLGFFFAARRIVKRHSSAVKGKVRQCAHGERLGAPVLGCGRAPRVWPLEAAQRGRRRWERAAGEQNKKAAPGLCSGFCTWLAAGRIQVA